MSTSKELIVSEEQQQAKPARRSLRKTDLLNPNSRAKDSRPRKNRSRSSKIYDDPAVTKGYESVPLIEVDPLPRGGISLETKAVGRIQFGIPPETIKDSMLLGIEVPSVYIVPIERFCREMGPALGINLAEFEFPAYFNYFIRQKRCQLIVDSDDAERDIRQVFGETLLGPEAFRDHSNPVPNASEDFDPSFEEDARPNFYKEFLNFRTSEASSNYQELTIDTLLEFCHFSGTKGNIGSRRDRLGVPPIPEEFESSDSNSNLSESRRKDRARRRQSLVSRSEGVEEQPLDCINEDNLELELSDDVSAGNRVVSKTTRPSLSRRNSDPDSISAHVSRRESGAVDGLSTPKPERRSSLTSAIQARKVSLREPQGTRRSSMPMSMDIRTAASQATTALSTKESAEIKEYNKDSPKESSLNRNSDHDPAMAGLIIDPTSGRRGSIISDASDITGASRSRISRLSFTSGTSLSFFDLMNDEEVYGDLQETSWMYSQVKWLGEVATVYPTEATEEQKKTNTTPRVEIFKMAGGTEYIVHDVNKDNIIVGKAKFSGTVRIPDQLSVEGFVSNETDHEDHEENHSESQYSEEINEYQLGFSNSYAVPPTFHPPSFGVTVLGNSHGFDKNGSTSGYVLWVNGRGIMIDPPPYSSATLEREGIRPQMIMAIIITHCHADHDAGAFQKVMTGQQVAIITTPSIYKSFIRKYSALSGLMPTLLRHSHRHRPAIIGQPLRFQGAVFHFSYTLHTIPCISFKVQWRGRSIVFTGDHMNIPEKIDMLEEKGVLSKGRADGLRGLPIQDCDVLLHEAGAPPIHTPLYVLQALPPEVKDRLYVVHTAAIPPDSGLRVAPTGTAGTLRLDSLKKIAGEIVSKSLKDSTSENNQLARIEKEVLGELDDEEGKHIADGLGGVTAESLSDGGYPNLTVVGDFNASASSFVQKFNGSGIKPKVAPLVFLRPTCVSDAWFILNLLSAIPFFSSLSYSNTLEVLEIAQVEMYCAGEVVLTSSRRPEVLCVFWEGTCVERFGAASDYSTNSDGSRVRASTPGIWYAGDWTGPVSLQPDIHLSSAAPDGEKLEDIVAVSSEGVKVIVLMMKDLQHILKTGSKLFRKYLALTAKQEEKKKRQKQQQRQSTLTISSIDHYSNDGLLEVLQMNSVLSRLTALQLRHLESLAEGPRFFQAHSLLWKVGDPVDYAYLIVSGTATLGRSKLSSDLLNNSINRRGSTGAIKNNKNDSYSESSDELRLTQIIPVDPDKLLDNLHPNSEYARLGVTLQLRLEEMEAEMQMAERLDNFGQSLLLSKVESIAQMNRDRFANKVLARLYARHAYTHDLTFSRGIFLSDTSRMVSGDLASINHAPGDGSIRSSIGSLDHHCHTSNMSAGPEGCVVLVFPRATLVPFLNSNPGVLLCLLGTQVLV